jgi:UDP-glucose 4-epimerase
MIGEDPQDIPNNLMPFVSQVAVGRREKLMVFGDDYDTADGTGVRDFIHVVDLASGHVAAVSKLNEPQCVSVNLGTGKGVSVLQMVQAFSKVIGRNLPYEIVARRPGDVASSFADAARAEKLLGWKATHNVDDMCRDTWRWQSQNPMGYAPLDEDKKIA